jgi:hypothetical protein
MAATARKNISLFFVLLAVVPAGFLSACDWLTGSENVERRSPFIDKLTVTPKVRCGEGNPYAISFRYDDPQGDIAVAVVSMRLEGETVDVQETYPWPANMSRNNGTVTLSDFFACGTTEGNYLVTVWVEDDGGHKSNERTAGIELY